MVKVLGILEVIINKILSIIGSSLIRIEYVVKEARDSVD